MFSSILLWLGETVIGALFKSLWGSLFPPKTSADQRAADLSASVKEANDAGIPIIAIMSSDCDLREAAYPIVANDTSRETVRLILTELTSCEDRLRFGLFFLLLLLRLLNGLPFSLG